MHGPMPTGDPDDDAPTPHDDAPTPHDDPPTPRRPRPVGVHRVGIATLVTLLMVMALTSPLALAAPPTAAPPARGGTEPARVGTEPARGGTEPALGDAELAAVRPGTACPSTQVPATAFTDTVRTVHRAAIDCLHWWGLTEGTSATTYGAGGAITRGQTAAMIARLLARTGETPDGTGSAGFADTDGHRFEDAIDLLAGLGIVQGRTATTFDPDGATTRAQMATVVVRTLERAYGIELPAAAEPFTDVAATDTHHDAIGALVAAQITTGTSATTYHPAQLVTREQMATFLTRTITVLVQDAAAKLPTARPAPDDAYASTVRGTWVHLFDDTLKSRASITALIDEMAAADVNTLVVQVARRHDAYYDSEVLPATRDPQLTPGLDVLAALLPLAHARGIEVHAWIAVAPTYHPFYEDIGVGPEELGADVAWRTRTVDGTDSEYLDIGLEAVHDHVAAIVGELATDHDLDAIHLDYVRYQSNRHGYHPDALARFRVETGATGTPSPTDATWSTWRRSQGYRLIDRARAAARAADPGIELSAAVISFGDGPATPDRVGFQGTRSFRDVLQDWDGWARRSRLDAVMPMNYLRAHDPSQAAAFGRWLRHERALAASTGVAIVPGIGGYLNAPDAALAQVHAAMAHADGAMVYSYQQPTLDGSRDIWTDLARTRWGYPPAAP